MKAQEVVVAEGLGPLLCYFSSVLLIPKLNTNSHHNTFSTVSQGWPINSVLSSESGFRDNPLLLRPLQRDLLGAPTLPYCAFIPLDCNLVANGGKDLH